MGRIRIIAGEFKGRRLAVPAGRRLRPTAERVREALFSILGERVVGARVLDAYAGTGALGFEALSRGAGEVLFVEADPAAARRLRENVEALGAAARCSVHEAEAVGWLGGARAESAFDLILADPPYAGGEGPRLVGRVAEGGLLPGGWLVLERDAARPPAAHGAELSLFRTARYGGTCLDFYRTAGS